MSATFMVQLSHGRVPCRARGPGTRSRSCSSRCAELRRVALAASCRELLTKLRVAPDEVDEAAVLWSARPREAERARLTDPDRAPRVGRSLRHVASST